MAQPKFKNGDIVYLDPVGDRRSADKGKVLGVTRYLDGSVGYVISVANLGGGVVRHHVTQDEVQPIAKPASAEVI
ncbi:hypothetical protein UFOVP68_28 [uncultured Caudovirales phage]|uniref:Uncharacterized protein n=1 Tax=uncultured Caudovirales phage TaxID=2100421 RepID=A0A6J5KYW2_9CAUD|nr:hypothetical protein UFOVP68_28 [uncultured Caudovirales phage]